MLKNILAFTGGALIGFGTAYIALEDRFGKRYAEMANANRRAYEKAGALLAVAEIDPDHNKVAFPEVSYSSATSIDEGKVTSSNIIPLNTDSYVDPRPELTAESIKNDYAKAFDAAATTDKQFVNGEKNQYGISYLEEEEFMEEDGRDKIRVDIIMNEDNPVFLFEGAQEEEWASKVGDSILLDMFQKCPPGIPPVLYVRNHRTDTDYEVTRVSP